MAHVMTRVIPLPTLLPTSQSFIPHPPPARLQPGQGESELDDNVPPSAPEHCDPLLPGLDRVVLFRML